MASSSDPKSNSSASRPDMSGAAPRVAPYQYGAPVPGGLEDEGSKAFTGKIAMGKPSARRSAFDARNRSFILRRRFFVIGVVLATFIIVLTLVLRYSSLFLIERIVATPTQHITSTQISALAAVPAGSTLFNVDINGIVRRLGANPWVGSVRVTRTLPDQLNIEVVERKEAAVVMLSNGTEAWRISNNGYWLEPVALQEASADVVVAAPADQASAIARNEGLVFVTDVSATLRPGSGKACVDDGVNALLAYLNAFSSDMLDRIVSAKASSREALSVVLDNGVEVSLGAPTDIELKERVVLAMLDEHEGEVTYINVRVTTAPTWRGVTNSDLSVETTITETDPVDITMGDALAPEDQPTQTQEHQSDEGTDAEQQVFYEWTPESVFSEDGLGYYAPDGTLIYAYYDENGTWINGYYDHDGNWVQIS